MIHKTDFDDYQPLADSEQITEPKKIIHLLKRFTKHYTPLTVQIANHPVQFTSCVVDVEKKAVLLDELLPSNGHQLLLDERDILVSGKLDGVDIQFFTSLKKIVEQDKLLTYYMALPTLLEHRQRRLTFRARIPIAMKLPVVIENIDGEKIKGELHNLSYGGAGMVLLPEKTAMSADALHKCAIQLPGGDWINCIVALRYSKDIPSRKTQFVGIQFVKLTATQSRLIGRCISSLERQQIRNKTVL